MRIEFNEQGKGKYYLYGGRFTGIICERADLEELSEIDIKKILVDTKDKWEKGE